MAIAFVQSVRIQGVNTTSATTSGITTTSGNAVILATAQFTTARFNGVSDSKGNAWGSPTGGPFDNSSGSDEVRQYLNGNITGGASHTFTQACSPADYPVLIAAEFSGFTAAPVADQTATGAQTGTAHSTSSTATLTDSNELVYANGAANSIGTPIQNTDGTFTQDQAEGGASGENAISAYKIVAATTAVSWNGWSIANSRPGNSVLVTYKAGGGGGGGTKPPWPFFRGMQVH